MKIFELKQERSKLLKEGRAMLEKAAEGRGYLNSDEEKAYNSMIHRVDEIGAELEKLQGDGKREVRALGKDINQVLSLLEQSEGHLDPQVAGQFANSTTTAKRTASGYDNVYLKGESVHERRSAAGYQLPDGIRADELSIGKYVRSLVTGDWSRAQAEYRAMGTGGHTSGYTVPTPLSDQLIDYARNEAQIFRAGARYIEMTSSSLTMARVTSDPTAQWKPENVAGTFGDMEFGALTMRARTLFCALRMSRELAEDSGNIEEAVKTALGSAIALKLDAAGLRGDGVGETPLGIRGWYDKGLGVQAVNMGLNGGALRGYADFSDAWQKIQEANGPDSGLSAIMAPRTAGTIDRFLDGEGQPLKFPESWSKIRKYSTNQIPINLVKGNASNASDIYVGDFKQLGIGNRGAMQIEVSNAASDGSESAFMQHQVWIKITMRADVVLLRPEWFVVIDGVIPTSS